MFLYAFLERNLMKPDANFTEVYPLGINWQHSIISSYLFCAKPLLELKLTQLCNLSSHQSIKIACELMTTDGEPYS